MTKAEQKRLLCQSSDFSSKSFSSLARAVGADEFEQTHGRRDGNPKRKYNYIRSNLRVTLKLCETRVQILFSTHVF